MTSGVSASRLAAAEVVDGKIRMVKLGIEDQLQTANFIEVNDINNDGYDDIIEYEIGTGTEGRSPIVYLNNKIGGFKRIDAASVFPQFNSTAPICQVSSILADFDGDGIRDIVYFPMNMCSSSQNLDGSLRLFKGNKFLQ